LQGSSDTEAAFCFSPAMLCPPEDVLAWGRNIGRLQAQYNISQIAGSIRELKLSPERIEKALRLVAEKVGFKTGVDEKLPLRVAVEAVCRA
jgi:hypothetical protein